MIKCIFFKHINIYENIAMSSLLFKKRGHRSQDPGDLAAPPRDRSRRRIASCAAGPRRALHRHDQDLLGEGPSEARAIQGREKGDCDTTINL